MKPVTDEELVKKDTFTFEDCVYILRRLRAPDGCPWDKAQTHESIRINMIEEAYELVDAIDAKDPEKLKEETGDVLMQALFHTLIEEEAGHFTVEDMLSALAKKLVTRHTHVFGKDKAKSEEGALSVWDKNKMKEKRQETYSDAVNDVPEVFPALLRAEKIAKRVCKGGWTEEYPQAQLRLEEQARAFGEAAKSGDKSTVHKQLGALLMSVAYAAYLLHADSEQALLDTAKEVQRQYTAYEKGVLADGKDVNALTEKERAAYFRKANDDRKES